MNEHIFNKLFNVKQIIGCTDLKEITPETHYLFTGKGPRLCENNFHLGHWLLYSKLGFLSKNFEVFFQLSDLEKTNNNFKNLFKHFKSKQLILENFLKFLNLCKFNKENLKIMIDSENYSFLTNSVSILLANVLKINKLTQRLSQDSTFFNGLSLLIQATTAVIGMLFLKKKPVIITANDELGPFLELRSLVKEQYKPIILVIEPLKNSLLKDKMSTNNQKTAIFIKNIDFKKTISDTNLEKDFCFLFIEELLPLLIQTEQYNVAQALKNLSLQYETSKNSLLFKTELQKIIIDLLKENSETPFNFNSFNLINLNKEIIGFKAKNDSTEYWSKLLDFYNDFE